MKHVKTYFALAAVLTCMWAAAAAQVFAQTSGSAVVVTVASVDETMADITWVTQAAGVPQFAGLATFFAGNYTRFLDTTKPSGVLVNLDASGQPSAVGFIPVRNMQGLLGALAQQLGQPTDAGNGVKQLQGPQGPLFVKEGGGFAFISNTAENLGNVPTNPAASLNGLEKKYNIAVSVNMDAVPADARNGWLQMLRSTVESNPNLPEAQRQQMEASFSQLEQLATQSEEIVIGLAIDASSRSVYIDFNMTAKAGSELANQLSQMANAKSDFAGFNMPGSAALFRFSSVMAESDKVQGKAMLNGVLQQALNELDADQELPTE